MIGKTMQNLLQLLHWLYQSKILVFINICLRVNRNVFILLFSLYLFRDHRTVYVGDARGRVFSWSVCEIPGKAADHWLKDEGADYCAGCTVKFTIYERKHHCRNCGQVFCSKCSRFESEISKLRILKPVRVCQSCYAALKSER